MKASLFYIPVRDQTSALRFYTEKLGFVKQQDVPLGGDNRRLTEVAREWPDGPELLLEPAPLHFEPTRTYQDALTAAGIPWTQFDVGDVEGEYERLRGLDVDFSTPPTVMGPLKVAVFNDTCGNLIQLVEELDVD